VLTVHLTGLDLSRTVVSPSPAVLVELGAAGDRMVLDIPPDRLVRWTARTRAALRPVMRPYLDLCRAPSWKPDFMVPTTYGTDLRTELEQVLRTPRGVLRAELEPHLDSGELPARVGDLASGSARAMERLGAAAVAFHEVAVAPYWTEIVAAVHADRAARGTTIVGRGVEQVLRTLSPFLRWDSSRLSYECERGADVDVEPAGRGVLLVPSYLEDQPAFSDVGGAPVTITYPIDRDLRELRAARPLSDLLGRTRAAVLGAVRGGRTTTELAHTVGTSLGSASQHAAVLRSAGLISTHRTGPAVLHSLTPLGESLLQAADGRLEP
jgi:hypothetical protein